jgi:hypothetical protein
MSRNPKMTWRYWLNEAWLQITCRHPPENCVNGTVGDGGSWWLCTRCSCVRVIPNPVAGREAALAEAASAFLEASP